LRLLGTESLTNFSNDTDSGIIQYVGYGTYTSLAAGTTYYDLIINSYYKNPIGITNDTGSELTNYQVKLELTSSNFDFSSSTNDGRDVRVYASDDTAQLNYWVESWDQAGQTATIWVKVPSLPTNGTTVYLYHGNSELSSTSSGANTFDFFDGFTGSSLDLDTWNVYGLSNSVSNSVLTLDTPTTSGGISANQTFSPSGGITYRISQRAKLNSASSTGFVLWGFSTEAQPWNTRTGIFGYKSGGTDRFGTQNMAEGGDIDSDIGSLDTEYHIFSTTLNTGFEMDGSSYNWGGGDIATAYPAVATWSSGADTSIDWVHVSKCASVEPNISVNSEVAGGTFKVPTSSTLTVNNDVTITTGQLDGNGEAINVGGNWSNSGTFTHGNGTVTFNGVGARTISPGSSSFYNLKFGGAGTYTLSGDLTIENNLEFIWASGYSYRKSVVIDNTKVDDDLTNYPLLFSVTDVALKDTNNSGNVTSTSGYDIIFTDEDGNQLDHEIESYDGSAGTFVAWVRIPTLANSQDTTVHVYYGNSSISTSQENAQSVWNSNYVGVWHMEESSGTVYNSTSDQNNASVVGNPQQNFD